MTINSIYLLANALAIVGWALLFAAAFTSLKVQWVASRFIPVMLAGLYAVLIVGMLPFRGGGFGSLQELTQLFAQPEIALVGWIHYLAFDLFIGGWQVETVKREQLPTLLLLPSLLLTLVFGPVGLLFFIVLRYALKSKEYSASRSEA